MNALNHYEHSASVEGYGVEADGNDGYTRVPTVQFEYPEDEEPERPVVRDQWRDESLLVKCQRRFAPVKSGDVMATPMLDKRLDVLQFALREAVEKMDVAAICKLADKARAATERLAAEKIAEASPGTRGVARGHRDSRRRGAGQGGHPVSAAGRQEHAPLGADVRVLRQRRRSHVLAQAHVPPGRECRARSRPPLRGARAGKPPQARSGAATRRGTAAASTSNPFTW